MDVIKFCKEMGRMTQDCNISCKVCPLSCANNGTNLGCRELQYNDPEKCVHIVEEWSKAHPKKTRQSELLKLFPKASMTDGVIDICPNELMVTYNCKCNSTKCEDCCRQFRLEEIEEDGEQK